MKTITKVAFAAAALVFPALAFAATFNPSDGTGSVSKADIIAAYAWTGPQFDQLVTSGNTGFSAVAIATTTWNCSKVTGKSTTVTTRTHVTVSSGAVTDQAVQNHTGKITSFTLTGWNGAPTVSNSGPVIGSCAAGATLSGGPTAVQATAITVTVTGQGSAEIDF